MDPIKNPFTPSAGTRPPALAGREREIESFRVMIGRLAAERATKSIMLTGLRGVGKTVLLTTFRDMAESQRLIADSIEVTHEMDFKAAMARLARRAVLALNPGERIKDRAWQAARILKGFSVKIPGGGELGIDIDALRGKGDSGHLQEDLSDLFVAIGEAAKERRTAVIFFFDEIQFLKKEDLEALIAAIHQTSQRLLPIGIVGAGLPQLPRIAGEAKSYAERLFDFPKIDKLDNGAAREALELPVRQQNIQIERSAVDAIIEFTEGYPYFLQEYGKHAWNIASGAVITRQDVDNARPAVVAQLDENFFRVRLERTTITERIYIVGMAHLGRGPYKTGDVAAALGKGSTTVAPLRGHLINKGLIYGPSYGMTDFTVPQFDDFLRRNFPAPLSSARPKRLAMARAKGGR